MEVSLIAYTPKCLKVMYTAAKTCVSSKFPHEIWKDNPSRAKIIRLLRKIYQEGHHSIFEHCFFTFAISGISRTCSHQLVRHRLASYAQQSQRYVNMKKEAFVIPESIRKNKELKEKFERFLENSKKLYEEFSGKIPKEDARFILPQAISTNLVMTLNLRELMNIAKERLCLKAQWEIRELVSKMRDEVKKVDSFLSELMQPKCVILGYCPEEKSCGLMPKNDRED